MRRLWVSVLVALVPVFALSQYHLNNKMPNGKDSLGVYNGSKMNVWNVTQEMMENVWYFAWDAQRQADTLRVRPNQYWDMMVDNKQFKATLFGIVGAGNFRKSNWECTYNGAVLTQTRDTIVATRFRPTTKHYPFALNNASVPESLAVTYALDMSSVVLPDTAYLGIRGLDLDQANEGVLLINDHQLALFGKDDTLNNDIVADVELGVPVSWWLNGTNKLTFVHSSGGGYRVDTVFLRFHTPANLWYEKTEVSKDTVQLSYADFGSVDGNGYVKAPSDSLRYGMGATWFFHWNKYLNNDPNGAIVDSVHEEIEMWPVSMYGSGTNIQVQIRVIHSEIPQLRYQGTVTVEGLAHNPTKKLTVR